MLFGEYIKGAKQITITDPYLRIFFQLRNLMEFVECAIRHKDEEETLHVHLITGKEDRNLDGKQDEAMEQIQEAAALAGVEFTWEYDTSNTLHARHIVVDDRWKISLDRVRYLPEL